MERQRTINKAVTLRGAGLHTGKVATLTFRPAPENHGVQFRRVDLEGKPTLAAHLDHVYRTDRGTSLKVGDAVIHTTEHVLAAVTGLQVDNILIDLDQEETPIMDGSSRFFVEALETAGFAEQEAGRSYLEIKEPVTFRDDEKKIELVAIPSDRFRVTTMINFETKVLSTQNAILEDITDFRKEIAPCRTFVFLHELEYLLKNELIKGGDLSNAIVFVNKEVSQEELDRLAELFVKPSVEVKKEGILNNLDLHFDNEPARHKLLDVIGDLALLGKPLKAHIYARRPGHTANIQLGRRILEHINKENKKMSNIPEHDPNQVPLMDINQIQRILPHRPPFLLIDKILSMTEDRVIGLKNVTMNEPFFVGHFPDEPVMPGVLQVEAMAQTGGILVLSSVPNPEDYTTLFLKIENVRFRQKVVPGDTLILDAKLSGPIRRGICQMTGTAYVGSKIVMEAQLTASILPKGSNNLTKTK